MDKWYVMHSLCAVSHVSVIVHLVYFSPLADYQFFLIAWIVPWPFHQSHVNTANIDDKYIYDDIIMPRRPIEFSLFGGKLRSKWRNLNEAKNLSQIEKQQPRFMKREFQVFKENKGVWKRISPLPPCLLAICYDNLKLFWKASVIDLVLW